VLFGRSRSPGMLDVRIAGIYELDLPVGLQSRKDLPESNTGDRGPCCDGTGRI
jgi:hypothetical protein